MSSAAIMVRQQPPKRVGFVDDDPQFLSRMEIWLSRHAMPTHATTDVVECLRWVVEDKVDTLVADLRMPAGDGILVLEKARKLQPGIEAIILTGYVPTASEKRRAEGNGIKIYQKESLGDLQSHLSLPAKEYSQKEAREMENRLKILKLVNDEWIADLVALLRESPELEQSFITSAEGSFTLGELIKDIELLRPRGVEYIRLWRRTVSTLLRLQRRKNV